MYVSKECIRQKNEKKTKMLALFNTLPEGDKDLVISMADSLVGKYGVCLKAETGRKDRRGFTNSMC